MNFECFCFRILNAFVLKFRIINYQLLIVNFIVGFLLISSTAFCQRYGVKEKVFKENKVILKNIVHDLVKKHRLENPKGALVVGLYHDTAKAIFSYGQVSHQNEQKPNRYTLFEIGSVTKPFTALLALELEREGKLQLNESITSYLPDSTDNAYLQQITLADLIAHQSGLPKTPVNLSVTKTNPNNPYEHYTNQDLLAYLNVYKPLRASKKSRMQKKEKKKFRYSDTAYGVLGFILERVSGQSYEALLQHYIFKPLQLKNTWLKLNENQKETLAAPYSFNQTPSENYSYQSSIEASSGLYTCGADLLDFMAAQMPDSLNENEDLNLSIQKSHAALAKSNMRRIDMSSGWYKISQGRKFPPLYVSNGGTGGYFTYVAFDKENRTGVVLLSNSSNRIDHIGVELINSQQSDY